MAFAVVPLRHTETSLSVAICWSDSNTLAAMCKRHLFTITVGYRRKSKVDVSKLLEKNTHTANKPVPPYEDIPVQNEVGCESIFWSGS